MKKILGLVVIFSLLGLMTACNNEPKPTEGDADVVKSTPKNESAEGKNTAGGQGTTGPVAPPDPSGN